MGELHGNDCSGISLTSGKLQFLVRIRETELFLRFPGQSSILFFGIFGVTVIRFPSTFFFNLYWFLWIFFFNPGVRFSGGLNFRYFWTLQMIQIIPLKTTKTKY